MPTEFQDACAADSVACPDAWPACPGAEEWCLVDRWRGSFPRMLRRHGRSSAREAWLWNRLGSSSVFEQNAAAAAGQGPQTVIGFRFGRPWMKFSDDDFSNPDAPAARRPFNTLRASSRGSRL